MRTRKRSNKDYRDPRFLEAPRRAASILVKYKDSWNSIIEAYWLLRKHEDEIGVPVTYDIVEQAYEIAIKEIGEKRRIHRASIGPQEASSIISSGQASASNM